MNTVKTTLARLAAACVAAALLIPIAGTTRAAGSTLVTKLNTDLVARTNGGNAAFATSDMSFASLPAGQPGWAPTGSLQYGAMKLIDGHASTASTDCDGGCDWGGNNLSPATPIDLIFTFAKTSQMTIDSVVLWQSNYSEAFTVSQYEVLVSTSAQPLLKPADYPALKSTFTPVGKYLLAPQLGTGQAAKFPPVDARYVMIRILSTQTNSTVAYLGEVQVFGPATGPGMATAVPATPSSGALGLKFLTATVSAGSQQVAQIVASKNALVAIVIDYPNGTQDVKQQKAGADGHLIYMWSIPKGIDGQVTMTVVSKGKSATGTFTAS